MNNSFHIDDLDPIGKDAREILKGGPGSGRHAEMAAAFRAIAEQHNKRGGRNAAENRRRYLAASTLADRIERDPSKSIEQHINDHIDAAYDSLRRNQEFLATLNSIPAALQEVGDGRYEAKQSVEDAKARIASLQAVLGMMPVQKGGPGSGRHPEGDERRGKPYRGGQFTGYPSPPKPYIGGQYTGRMGIDYINRKHFADSIGAKIVGQIKGVDGRTFHVQVVPTGGKYGRDKGLTNTGEPMVEFYDATYAGRPGFDREGQFVSRYNLSTLQGHTGGIDLQGDVPVWKIPASEMARIQNQLNEWKA